MTPTRDPTIRPTRRTRCRCPAKANPPRSRQCLLSSSRYLPSGQPIRRYGSPRLRHSLPREASPRRRRASTTWLPPWDWSLQLRSATSSSGRPLRRRTTPLRPNSSAVQQLRSNGSSSNSLSSFKCNLKDFLY